MIRVLGLVSLAWACASCRPAPPAVPTASPGMPVPEATPAPAAPRSPSEILEAHHHAAIEVEGSLGVPEGAMIVYSYGRLEAELGARAAAGRDVHAELAAAERECQDERAALDPEEREWIEAEHESCEALAGARLLGDEQLMPSCRAFGIALFDREGALLHLDERGGPCLRDVVVFESRDLSPSPSDDVVLVVDFETLGELTRGGWGTTSDASHLLVLAVETDEEGEPVVLERFELELGGSYDGGNCGGGTDRRVRIADDGALEVFEQRWNECDEIDCIQPEDADEDAAPEALCKKVLIEAERAPWDFEDGAWGPLEAMAHDETELPPSFWHDPPR